MSEMTVSELARRAGTTADTIRYYERIGLLPGPASSVRWSAPPWAMAPRSAPLARFLHPAATSLPAVAHLWPV